MGYHANIKRETSFAGEIDYLSEAFAFHILQWIESRLAACLHARREIY